MYSNIALQKMFVRYHKGHVPKTMTGSGLKLPSQTPSGLPHSLPHSLTNKFSNLTITPQSKYINKQKTRKYIKF